MNHHPKGYLKTVTHLNLLMGLIGSSSRNRSYTASKFGNGLRLHNPIAAWLKHTASGGLMPFVARDLLSFPMARPSDGLVDLVVQETVRFRSPRKNPRRANVLFSYLMYRRPEVRCLAEWMALNRGLYSGWNLWAFVSAYFPRNAAIDPLHSPSNTIIKPLRSE